MRASEFQCFYTRLELVSLLTTVSSKRNIWMVLRPRGDEVLEIISLNELSDELLQRGFEVFLCDHACMPPARGLDIRDAHDRAFVCLGVPHFIATDPPRLALAGVAVAPGGIEPCDTANRRLYSLVKKELKTLCPYPLSARNGSDIYKGRFCSQGAVEMVDQGFILSYASDRASPAIPIL